ncbi:amidohydrolase family protein [Mycolicibacterium sp. 120266]|uniref:amidohydrolase family protein n=1 Tax=Mycolicibacterium sp. 120266 TaxID=3090601 RepID=UPI00299CF1A1|nr:amidohydrolase family protein [Mycolicibacterium sp. 120266]MDX1875191.1 amidohydrolase family protein [Mycolicibacterium sp. 120266]
MTVIAIEEHWTSPRLAAALMQVPPERRDDSLALNDGHGITERLEDLGDARIADMDDQGIDLAVISLAPPGTGPLSPADAVPFSRDMNDIAAEAVSRHPTRLRAMATLPMSDAAACGAELDRATGLGLVGAMVYGRTGDVMLDDPRYDDLFETAAALGQPIFIHPQIPPRVVRDISYSGFDEMTDLALSTFAWGWHIEAGLAALRLIVRGTFDRHPDLQIVLGHWGELLPLWSDRANGLARFAGLQRSVTETIRSNIHITSSGMLSVALLRHTLAVTTIDRLMFSTDYPFQRPTKEQVETFLGEFATETDRQNFMSDNARRLFNIDGVS